MKDSLVHLSRYFMSAFAGIVAISLVLLVMGSSRAAILSLGGPILFAGWAAGMVPATLRLLRRAKKPVITGVLAAGLTAGIVAAAILIPGIDGPNPGGTELDGSLAARTVQPGRVYQGEQYSVVVDRVVGTELGQVIVANHAESVDSRLRVYREGYWDQAGNQLILPEGPDLDLDRLRGFGAPMLPVAVRTMARDVHDFWATVVLVWSSPIPDAASPLVPAGLQAIVSPVIAVLMTTVLLMGIWIPLRLTRWPLLNAIVAVAYLRAVVALPAGVRSLMSSEIVPRWVPEADVAVYVVTASVAVGVLLVIGALVLPSLTAWRHAMHVPERRS